MKGFMVEWLQYRPVTACGAGSNPAGAANEFIIGSLVKLAITPDLHSGILGSSPKCIHFLFKKILDITKIVIYTCSVKIDTQFLIAGVV